MNELVIFNKIKWLISYSDKYVFNSFTKVHINLKIRYQDRLYSLLENCIRSNTNTGNIRIKYQKEKFIIIKKSHRHCCMHLRFADFDSAYIDYSSCNKNKLARTSFLRTQKSRKKSFSFKGGISKDF